MTYATFIVAVDKGYLFKKSNCLICTVYRFFLATSSDSVKLEKHLKLLKEEYTKLQKSYAELERKYSQAAAANEDHDLSGEFSSFISRLVMTVATLYGRTTYSDITIKLKDKTMPAHKFVLNARSEEWREEVLMDKSELGKVWPSMRE